jgi:hypothetical protein
MHAPPLLEYMPATQLEHELLLLVEDRPATQFVQELPLLEYLPATQFVHEVLLLVED